MSDLVLGLKELFIAVFFESALALLWISLIASAFSRPQDFVQKPITTQYKWLRRMVVPCFSSRKRVIATVALLLILGYPLGVAMQRATDDFIELGSFWMPKSSEFNNDRFPWESIGRDESIRSKSMRTFRYKLQREAEMVRRGSASGSITPKDALNIARKANTRRAFTNGAYESALYMHKLLELVRICQATLAHVGLLAISYLIFIFVYICIPVLLASNGNILIQRVVTFLGVVAVLIIGPRAHDMGEFAYPVFALLLAVAAPILVFLFKYKLTRAHACPALMQLGSGFSTALIISYLATFSWSEHRENYFEAAIVLGAEAGELPHRQGLAQPNVTDFETSGSAVVGKKLLIADDELIGAVLQCPEPLLTPWNCRIAKVQRKRKQSQPYTEQPRLAAVQDFEGLASDRDKIVFLVGSHEGKDGVRRLDREFLIRADWDDDESELEWAWSYEHLSRDFQKAFHDFDVEFQLTGKKIHNEFSVEGLAYRSVCEKAGILYVGLRGPLTPDGEAVILAYQLDPKEPPTPMSYTVHRVDLHGLEIRGLEWDYEKQRLLIVAVDGTNEDVGLARPGVLMAYSLEASSYEVLQSFRGGTGDPEAVSRTPSGQLLVLFDSKISIHRGGVYVPE